MHIMAVFGTRPEAIKFVTVVHALQAHPSIDLTVCVTGQHRDMLDQVLDLAAIQPDIDLDLMTKGQTLTDITSTVLHKLPDIFARVKPDRVLVQGDTTTAYATALAAFYASIPVGHIEAGLRSFNNLAPWPEEANRRMVSVIADMHFAPTASSRDNLLQENIADEQIVVTGNTVIDALHFFRQRTTSDDALRTQLDNDFDFLDRNKRLILVTSHRRENFDGGVERICSALKTLAARGDVQLVFPVHPNPNVREPVEACLDGQADIHLINPQDYIPFLYLMDRAHLIISDSGGVQEEAPALGKPVLVLRETTERPEGVEAGTARLVGTDTSAIVNNAMELLDNDTAYATMSKAHNPFGDGKATERIIEHIMGNHAQARGAA